MEVESIEPRRIPIWSPNDVEKEILKELSTTFGITIGGTLERRVVYSPGEQKLYLEYKSIPEGDWKEGYEFAELPNAVNIYLLVSMFRTTRQEYELIPFGNVTEPVLVPASKVSLIAKEINNLL